MNISPTTNNSSQLLQINAERVSLTLLGTVILATILSTYVAWSTGQFFIYYYVGLFCAVGVLYGFGTIAVFRKRRNLGVGLLITGMILGFISIPISFLNLAPAVALIIGFCSWIISVLTLEGTAQTRATIIGLLCAFATLIIDFFIPFSRIFFSIAIISTFLIGILNIGILLVFFFLSFRAFDLLTKLTVITVSIVLAATAIPILILTQSTRSALIDSTQVEIELRGEQVATAIDAELQGHIDRLETLVSNQNILRFIAQDTADLDNLDPQLIERVLIERNRIWVNENNQFLLEQHFPFFSRLRNQAGDILRRYKQRFPETEQIFIVNKYGSIVAMANGTDTDRYIYNDTDWWTQLVQDQNKDIYIGRPQLIHNNQTMAIPVAVPIDDINNNLIGAVYTTYSTNALVALLDLDSDPHALETNFSMLLANQEMLPLMFGQHTLVPSQFESETIEELFEMNFVQQQNLQENNIITAFSFEDTSQNTILPEGWGILVSRPLSSVEEIVRGQQLTQILIGLLLIALGIALAQYLSRAVSAPIVNLADIAQQLEGGNLAARATVESADEIGELAIAFNQMADQSQRLVSQLETRVAERTQALETSFQVSQTLSRINEKNELVRSVVNQLQSAFDYYHVHIYLLNPIDNMLRLVAGSGETGDELLKRKHVLKIGKGLVGQAAASNTNILVPDVTREPQWVPNELLPNTKSELAIPITLGNEVLGVIDVQDDEINRFGDQDSDLLRSIADQVAVALRNAEQFESAQHRADREQQLNRVRERILRTQDIDSALKTAAREISNLLGKKATSVVLDSEAQARFDITDTQRIRISKEDVTNGNSQKMNGNHSE